MGAKRTVPVRVGIKDVAQAADVSVATVSRVLNGSETVRPELRSRVLRVSQELGYRPNPHARALHTGRSHAIGIGVATAYMGGFLTDLFDALENTLASAGYRLIVAGGNGERASEKATLVDLLNRHVDGLLVYMEAICDSDLASIAVGGTPTLVLGRTVSGIEDRCLTWDQRAGAALATGHLLALGHRRIGHITGPPRNLDARLRREGYLETMRGAGVQVDPGWIVEGSFEEQGGRDAMRALLDRKAVTAAFVGNDRMALGALNALWERGMSCPSDVSMVGFDDAYGAAFATPPLTTVKQPLEELGRLAAQRLLDDIRGEQGAGRPDLPPLALVVRASAQRREVP